MKRIILMIGVLVLASVGSWGQGQTGGKLKVVTIYGQGWENPDPMPTIQSDINQLIVKLNEVVVLRVDERGAYHYAQGYNAERVINEMAAVGAKWNKAQSAASTGLSLSEKIGLEIELISPEATRLNKDGDWRFVMPKHAHAQQQPKEVASAATPPKPVGPIEVPFPTRENEMLKKLQEQADKINADYKLDEYNKEAKAALEAYQGLLATLKTKYKLDEREAKFKPLQEQFAKIITFAEMDAGLTDEQKKWNPQPDEKHNWVWRKPLEQTKAQ